MRQRWTSSSRIAQGTIRAHQLDRQKAPLHCITDFQVRSWKTSTTHTVRKSLFMTFSCTSVSRRRLMSEEVRLEAVPVVSHVAAERALQRIGRRVTTAVHVKQRSVAKHGATRTYKRRLPLAEVCQDLIIGERRQRIWSNDYGGRQRRRCCCCCCSSFHLSDVTIDVGFKLIFSTQENDFQNAQIN